MQRHYAKLKQACLYSMHDFSRLVTTHQGITSFFESGYLPSAQKSKHQSLECNSKHMIATEPQISDINPPSDFHLFAGNEIKTDSSKRHWYFIDTEVEASPVDGPGFRIERAGPKQAPKLLIFATGSGITPLKALIESGDLQVCKISFLRLGGPHLIQ